MPIIPFEHSRPRLTCETTLASVQEIRVFWATAMEDLNQRFTLVPTVVAEVLRRERLNKTYEWSKRLKRLSRHHPDVSWDSSDIRRLSTLAGNAARSHLRDSIRSGEGPYRLHVAASSDEQSRIIDLESRIDDVMDDRIFDQQSKNWLADREIVIQALARGYDILATNNIRSITHALFRDWMARPHVARLELAKTILEPPQAEEALRQGYRRPIDWAPHMAMLACVTDPDDQKRAFAEVAAFIQGFGERGMMPIASLIEKRLNERSVVKAGLDRLRRSGPSSAARYEAVKGQSVAQALSRQTGLSPTAFADASPNP